MGEHMRAGDPQPIEHRRATDSLPLRLLVGTTIVCTFIILGVLSFAIVNINSQVNHSTETLYDGIICILEKMGETDREADRSDTISQIGEFCSGFSEGVASTQHE